MEESTAYDLAGRVAERIYPDASGQIGNAGAERLTHSYDDAGRLRKLGPYAEFAYTADGLVSALTLGNGSTMAYEYDADRRWTDAISVSNGTGPLARIDYEHDGVGRIKQQRTKGQANLTYSYDAVGRLVKVDSNEPARRESWSYDAIGRFTSSSSQGSFEFGNSEHVHAVTATNNGSIRNHDAVGNVTEIADPSGRRLQLTWSVDGKVHEINDLVSGARHRYAYDLGGRRVADVWPDGTGTARYFGPRLEVDAAGNFIKTYMAGDRIVARAVAGKVSYLHADAGRNIRWVTDSQGAVVDRVEYAAFGKPRPLVNAPERIGFAATRESAALGLVSMGARIYDPVVGQFLSPDSIVPDVYRPSSLDRFAYVEQDPVNHWDPSGHMKALVEYRKLRIAETQYLMTQEEAFAHMPRVTFDYGMTQDQSLEAHRRIREAEQEGAMKPLYLLDVLGAGKDAKSIGAIKTGKTISGGGGGGGGRIPGPVGASVTQLVLGHTGEGDKGTESNDSIINWWSGRGGILLASVSAFIWANELPTLSWTAAYTSGLPMKLFSLSKSGLASELIAVGAAGAGGFVVGTYLFEGQEFLGKHAWNSYLARKALDFFPIQMIGAYRHAPDPVLNWWYRATKD